MATNTWARWQPGQQFVLVAIITLHLCRVETDVWSVVRGSIISVKAGWSHSWQRLILVNQGVLVGLKGCAVTADAQQPELEPHPVLKDPTRQWHIGPLAPHLGGWKRRFLGEALGLREGGCGLLRAARRGRAVRWPGRGAERAAPGGRGAHGQTGAHLRSAAVLLGGLPALPVSPEPCRVPGRAGQGQVRGRGQAAACCRRRAGNHASPLAADLQEEINQSARLDEICCYCAHF